LCGAQEGLGSVPADTGALVDVEIARPLVAAAVEVLADRNAGLLRRLLKGIEDRPADTGLLHPPFTAGAMLAIGPPVMVFGLPEIAEDIVPAPPLAAHLPPEVVITRLSTHVDHAVNRRTSAEQLAARIGERAAVEAFFLLRQEAPVRARIVDTVEIADRDM